MSETHETKEAKMRIEREHEIMPFEDNGENAYIKNLEILAVLTDIVRKHQDMKFEQILDRYIHTRNAAPNCLYYHVKNTSESQPTANFARINQSRKRRNRIEFSLHSVQY